MIVKLPIYPTLNFSEDFPVRCVYPEYENELVLLIEKCGNKSAFRDLYVQRLRYLKEAKTRCHLRASWFEKVKHDPQNRLYSMKFKSGQLKKNLRILFIYTKKYPILLCPFQEDDNKKTGDKSYNKNIYTANKRIDDLIRVNFIERDDILCHHK